MASLAVVSTPQSRPRRMPDIGALVADLRRQHGKHASHVLSELLLEDAALARAVAAFVVETLGRDGRGFTAAAPRRRAMPSARERAEHAVAEKAAVEKLVNRVKATVLDMEIGGTKLRFLTGAEVARLGAGFTKLAERVPADALVGEIVTEAEAAALMRAAV
jgi:hypothetical protein